MRNELATILNSSGVSDHDEPKVYYIRLTVDGVWYWKLGMCSQSLRKRFSGEPRSTFIEILKLWPKETAEKAKVAEAKLRAKLKGDLPFLGRCGPLKRGGNAETYSHDALNGAPCPDRYFVKMFTTRMYTVEVAYINHNPRALFSHLHGEVRYMDYLFGPKDAGEGHFFQVPLLSSRSHVVVATDEYLYAMLERRTDIEKKISRLAAEDALKRYIIVKTWKEDYPRMVFLGTGFSLRNAPMWSRGWEAFA